MEPSETPPPRFICIIEWDEFTNTTLLRNANDGIPNQQILFALETWTEGLREVMQADFFDNNGKT